MNSSGANKKTTPSGLTLYPYQERWVADDTRFKIASKSRQIGFTFAAAYRAVHTRLDRPGLTLWLSASQRQALEAMEHVKRFVKAMKVKADYEEIEFSPQVKQLEVRFDHNNARIVAVPANPDTIRGFSGDIVLDEFAFHRDAQAIWRAAFATVTRGFQLEVISTAAGCLGRYYDLARAAGLSDPSDAQRRAGQWTAGPWSAHWCDVHKAVSEGFPVNPAELEAAVADDFTWRQEYLCEFISDAESLIPTEQIVPLEDPACPAVQLAPDQTFNAELLLGERPGLDNVIYLGGDLGRRKDRTVLWAWSRGLLDNLLYTRGAVSLRGWNFDRQEAALDALMPFVHRACIDASGLGMMMVERLQRRWGAKVEPVNFTLPVKENLAMLMVRFFSERMGRIPYATWVRGAIAAVKRHVTEAGNIRYDAARTEEGHADAFWAAGLGLHAAEGPALSTEIHTAVGSALRGADYGLGRGGRGSAYAASAGY